ncbi:MAG: rhomboid family intramembrane serine protease [Fimbriimonadaceae bacterium]
MIPIRDNLITKRVPVVTFTLIGLNILIYLWDRQGSLLGASVVFGDLTMRPVEIVQALQGGDRFALFSVFTAMFLHGNLVHLLGNLLYLFVFGPAVENGLGSWRYMLYYLFWGVVAAATHVFVEPSSDIPTLGASGAIGGVLGSYFLLFPANKIEFVVPLIPYPFVISAWVLLGTWFLYQVFVRQEGVATWAHAGGFLAGMLTILIAGGRLRLLEDKDFEENDAFD